LQVDVPSAAQGGRLGTRQKSQLALPQPPATYCARSWARSSARAGVMGMQHPSRSSRPGSGGSSWQTCIAVSQWSGSAWVVAYWLAMAAHCCAVMACAPPGPPPPAGMSMPQPASAPTASANIQLGTHEERTRTTSFESRHREPARYAGAVRIQQSHGVARRDCRGDTTTWAASRSTCPSVTAAMVSGTQRPRAARAPRRARQAPRPAGPRRCPAGAPPLRKSSSPSMRRPASRLVPAPGTPRPIPR
jgi:hypothetical protein